MTLLETVVEVTADESWPSWLHMLIGVVLGAAGPWLLKKGYKVTLGKPKAAAMLCAVAMLGLTGCAAGIQKEAARASINVLEPVIHDLEDRAGATESERKANQKQLDTLKEAVK